MEQNTFRIAITLRFANLFSLWNFARSLSYPVFEINTAKMHLTCQCTPTELKEAIEKYDAVKVGELSAN